MPKLENKEKSWYGDRIIDKETDTVAYFDDSHEYLDKNDGLKGISVTTLIGEYHEKFDANFWSAYKALESLCDGDIWSIYKKSLLATKKFKMDYVTKAKIDEDLFLQKQAEILEEYDRNRNEACELGTKVHAEIENAFYNKDKETLKKFGLGGKFEVAKGQYELNLNHGIYPEYLISYRDDDFLLCGQIDLLVVAGDEIILADHKTSKKIEFKSFYDRNKKSNVMMKFPVNNLQDANGNHYALQLSTYMWMLQKRNPKFKCNKLMIHWLDHDGNESFIEVPYLKDDVERMIKHFRKQQQIKNELNKIKPIKYE